MGELFIRYNPVSADSIEPLVRPLPEAFLGRTVRDTVQYVLQPEIDANTLSILPSELADKFKQYGPDDRLRAQKALDGLNMALNNPSQYAFELKAKTNTEPASMEKLALEDLLSKYTDRIIRKDTVTENGASQPYRLIELTGTVRDVGGYARN
jgi:predicted ribosome quality control (RQC) complex YloA/Tae2 family protein